ncbi:hypothetical protein VNO78_14996 [Psophocarpus tetragonolobus]|uniref:Uncharacterized protein n=1 Tax=Psophocarpus tetragonolobus TaxID=3891 RepID=A0AAN9XJI1_PSOTE
MVGLCSFRDINCSRWRWLEIGKETWGVWESDYLNSDGQDGERERSKPNPNGVLERVCGGRARGTCGVWIDRWFGKGKVGVRKVVGVRWFNLNIVMLIVVPWTETKATKKTLRLYLALALTEL